MNACHMMTIAIVWITSVVGAVLLKEPGVFVAAVFGTGAIMLMED